MTKSNIHPVFKLRRKPVIPVRVLTAVVLIVSVVGLSVYFRGKQQSHEIRYYDDVLFQKGIHTQPVTGKRVSYAIVTGIIPHHLLASDMLSGYFSLLARQKPKRILLIGPNHGESGNAPVISSRYIWKTPYGAVYPDENILKSLVADGHIHIDERVSEYEHSVGGLTAYMAYYLPGTKIIPLIVSGRMQLRDIMDVSQKLSEFMDKDTVLLSSVDFSHYLFSDEAVRKDAVTESLLRNFSYGQMYPLNSDYMDSTPAVIIALRVAELRGARKMEILAHTNSGIMQKNGSMPTTSYFSVALHE